MQLQQPFWVVLIVLMISMTSVAEPTTAESKAAEVTWSKVLESLDSEHPFDASVYNGAHVLFGGQLTDRPGHGVIITHALSKGKDRPVVIHVGILRYDASKQQSVDRGVTCHVTLREEEIRSVAEYPADSLVIRVWGIITHLDAATKTIEVQSEDTSVTDAE